MQGAPIDKWPKGCVALSRAIGVFLFREGEIMDGERDRDGGRGEVILECHAENVAAGARVALMSMMTGISEECWSAAWINALEFSLWNMAHDAPSHETPYGRAVVTVNQKTILRLLAREAGGWWTFHESGALFVGLDEWERSFRTLGKVAAEGRVGGSG
jgi:hypothetical protein